MVLVNKPKKPFNTMMVSAIITAFLATALFLPALLHAGEHVPGGVPQPGSRFTDNGDGTVTDHLSGLIWLKNANRFGKRTFAQVVSDCKNLTADGVTLRDGSSAGDWRLPTLKDFQTLLDYGQFNPALPDGHPFEGVQWRYWSGTRYRTAPNCAWLVDMVSGRLYTECEDFFYAWPVRGGDLESGGVTRPSPRFTDNGDGTVTDNLTRLIWLKNANRFGKKTWDQAVSHCKNLTDDGVTLKDGLSAGDWRLPTIKEIISLYDYSQYNPVLPAGHPFTGVQPRRYWTGSSYASTGTCGAWTGNMLNGGLYSCSTIDPYYVWPVRGGGHGAGVVTQPVPRFTPLESPRTEARGKIKDSYAFSHGVNAPCESLLTGFTDNGDGTVTDNRTRLIWLKNANHFGEKTWDQAVSDCKSLADDGVTLRDGSSTGDWRLPTVKDLLSLVDYGQFNPALPVGHPFANIQDWRYWTSVEYATGAHSGWSVNMLNGGVYADSRGEVLYLWPVRRGDDVEPGGVTRRDPRFTDNGNGTVTDNRTRLIWLKNANRFGERTWDQAMDDCKNLTDNGATLKDGSSAGDWRLPSLKEIAGLVDYGQYNPALPAGHPFEGVQRLEYWCSTPYGSSPCGAWSVSFRHGGYYAENMKIDFRSVWPVRGGKRGTEGVSKGRHKGLSDNL